MDTRPILEIRKLLYILTVVKKSLVVQLWIYSF